MSRLADIQRAVEMTSWCKVEYDWRAPADTRYSASLWCNAIGEHVVGYGPDAWVAVQAAHALSAMHENRRN